MIEISIGSYTTVFGNMFLNILYGYRQTEKNINEAGGIILGQVRDESIYLLKASLPSKKDKSSRIGFVRDKKSTQLIIDYEFYNSGRKTIYIGEWHSHPENNPKPSSQDLKMIKEQFKKNRLNESYILLVIVGLTNVFIGIMDKKEFKTRTIAWKSLQNGMLDVKTSK